MGSVEEPYTFIRNDAQVLEDIAEDNELTVEQVRSIAKENGISLSC